MQVFIRHCWWLETGHTKHLSVTHNAWRSQFKLGYDVFFRSFCGRGSAVDYILRDEATLAELVGNSAGDMVKGFVSLGGAAVLTAALPATAGILASGIFFAIASFGLGYVLSEIDNELGYSNSLIQAVEGYFL